MQFTTPIPVLPQPFLRPDSRIMLLGSCFADEMCGRMQARGLRVCANPFGTQYNPLSVAACLQRLSAGTPFTVEELIAYDGLYHLSLCHGSLSHATKEETLQAANKALQEGTQALQAADTLIITFGTAWVYEEHGEVVSNCHKRPASCFTRRRLDIPSIVQYWTNLLAQPALANKNIIFTISPIRHLKDGLHANQLSKATLLLAVDELLTLNGDTAAKRVTYFPAYELLQDELRDYRFYAADLCHPSPQAADYIYQRFEETFFTAESRQVLSEIAALKTALAHRPLHPESAQYQAFLSKTQMAWQTLCQRYPWLQ